VYSRVGAHAATATGNVASPLRGEQLGEVRDGHAERLARAEVGNRGAPAVTPRLPEPQFLLLQVASDAPVFVPARHLPRGLDVEVLVGLEHVLGPVGADDARAGLPASRCDEHERDIPPTQPDW
jgi:hypothetical protein